MKCPNCKQPFIEERSGKFHCSTCGWMEKIDKEWKSCEAPESPAPQEPEPEPATHEPDPATHEPDPAAHEPDPAALEPDPDEHEPDPAEHESDSAALIKPDPNCSIKAYLGGLITVTEVTEVDE